MEAKTQIIIPKNEENKHFHVLAVDDSIIERKMLEKLLTISSYHVTCVESGDKALEYLGLVNCHSPVIHDDDDGHVIDDHHHHDHVNDHHDDVNDDDDVEVSMICPSLPLPDNVHHHHHHHQGQGTRVNLIMTDYSMPGITGYDLLKRVKESSWKDVPVVVMSSENVPSRIHMCLEEGAEEFLLKPVRLSDLKKLQPRVFKATPTTTSCQSEEINKNATFLAANDTTNISNEEILKIIADHHEDYTNNNSNEEDTKMSYDLEKCVEISKMNL